MNAQYDGLTLPQLLERMHGVVLPDPVSWFPPGEGSWVLCAWLILVAALCLLHYLGHRRRNGYRREAVRLLDEIDVASAGAAAEVALIVKRVALVAYAREEVASLYGDDWARFLIASANHDARVEQAAGLIASAAYRPTVAAADILEPAKRWVRVHRA